VKISIVRRIIEQSGKLTSVGDLGNLGGVELSPADTLVHLGERNDRVGLMMLVVLIETAGTTYVNEVDEGITDTRNVSGVVKREGGRNHELAVVGEV
jgi:hypothetical protein